MDLCYANDAAQSLTKASEEVDHLDRDVSEDDLSVRGKKQFGAKVLYPYLEPLYACHNRAAVPFWGQSTWNLSGLPPPRDWSLPCKA